MGQVDSVRLCVMPTKMSSIQQNLFTGEQVRPRSRVKAIDCSGVLQSSIEPIKDAGSESRSCSQAGRPLRAHQHHLHINDGRLP